MLCDKKYFCFIKIFIILVFKKIPMALKYVLKPLIYVCWLVGLTVVTVRVMLSFTSMYKSMYILNFVAFYVYCECSETTYEK